MKQSVFTLLENEPLTRDVYRARLRGDISAISAPGQFVNLRLAGRYLRRPISVCDVEGDVLTLIYKVVGPGTAEISRLAPGAPLDLLSGLGNGYDLSRAGDHPLLLGGGVGVPPLYWLARCLRDQGKRVSVVLGFNTREEVFYEEEFRALGADVTVATVDGSHGVRGFVTDALPPGYSYFYTCGPEPMLKAVFRAAATGGQFSLEERMGCGFGACMGCSMKLKDGSSLRLCREGPVLEKEVLTWES